MTPRRYSMDRRAATVAETRQRIVAATMTYHGERGIYPTSFQEIARRADVSVATIYRHFPNLDALVNACGRDFFTLVKFPTPETFDFGSQQSAQERVGRLVQALSASFAAFPRGFENLHGESHLVEALSEAKVMVTGLIEQMVREALAPIKRDDRLIALVGALADFPFWKSLVDRGVPEKEVPDVIENAIRCAIDLGRKKQSARSRGTHVQSEQSSSSTASRLDHRPRGPSA